MYCSRCGKVLGSQAAYCSNCGAKQETDFPRQESVPCFHLPITENRKCDIKVWSDRIDFSGQFLYLKEKEFYQNKGRSDSAYPYNFLGAGYLSQRSYKKTLAFIISGVIMGAAKMAVDKLGELTDKANHFLQWVGHAFSLPEWMGQTVNFLAIVCLSLGVILFFSKKKVVEISFTDKRICIPQNSISQSEYAGLCQAIKTAKAIQTHEKENGSLPPGG